MKQIKFNFSKMLAALAISSLAFVSTNAFAEEYNFHVTNFEECPSTDPDNPINRPGSTLNNGDPSVHKMVTDYLNLRYNSTTKHLTVEALFNNGLGNIPTGFHFAVSKGPRPQGFSNLAAIYFDAKNPNDIKVLSYAYNVVACNCANYIDKVSNGVHSLVTSGSWLTGFPFLQKTGDTFSLSPSSLTPDPVFTSIGGNNNYVIEKSVQTYNSNGKTYRKFRLVLNTTQLNQFVPRHLPTTAPYTWEGAQFAEKIGLRFWAVNVHQVSYNSQGLLTQYDMGDDCSVCGYDDAPTNLSPICKSVNLTGVDANNNVKPGTQVTAQVVAYDKEKNQLQVNYSGQPTGSNFNVANGSLITPNSNSEAQINFDWTPGLGTNGKYNVNVQLTQQYGVDKAKVNCPFEFTVNGCEPIDWRTTINNIDNQIAQQLVDHHVKKLVRRIKNTRGKLNRAERTINKRAGEIGQEAWETLMSLQRERVIRQNCGDNVPGCDSIDTTRALNRVNQIAVELFGMVESLAPNLRKALTQKGIKGAQNTRRWRPVLNSAANLKDSATLSINSLPSTVYACERL